MWNIELVIAKQTSLSMLKHAKSRSVTRLFRLIGQCPYTLGLVFMPGAYHPHKSRPWLMLSLCSLTYLRLPRYPSYPIGRPIVPARGPCSSQCPHTNLYKSTQVRCGSIPRGCFISVSMNPLNKSSVLNVKCSFEKFKCLIFRNLVKI